MPQSPKVASSKPPCSDRLPFLDAEVLVKLGIAQEEFEDMLKAIDREGYFEIGPNEPEGIQTIDHAYSLTELGANRLCARYRANAMTTTAVPNSQPNRLSPTIPAAASTAANTFKPNTTSRAEDP